MALRNVFFKLNNMTGAAQQGFRRCTYATQTRATDDMKPGQTHFGYQVVDEEEKSKKGRLLVKILLQRNNLIYCLL